jgi:hypothetical protein
MFFFFFITSEALNEKNNLKIKKQFNIEISSFKIKTPKTPTGRVMTGKG